MKHDRTSRRLLRALSVLAPLTAFGTLDAPFAQSPRLELSRYCTPGIEDANGGPCIGASSVPAEGFLFPLGPDFFVSPFGRVGFGTTRPATRIDVEGTGGNGSTLRLRTTNAGAGGILLERSGGTPVAWSLSYDTAPGSRDFLVHDNEAAATRLRIDEAGTVQCERLDVGNATAGLQVRPSASSVAIEYGAPGALGSTLFTAYSDRLVCSRPLVTTTGLEISAFSSIQFDEHDVFASPPMMYLFEDGTDNFDRMVFAHSETYDDWGLRYDDDDDMFHFLAGGNGVMTIDLQTGEGKIGLEDSTPSNILTVVQGSATDPIADAWLTYSSRRWKENIEPIEDALGLVRELRGVTFDWKESGDHDLGMIAEEVGEVVPEVVAFEANGVDAQSIDYARLTAVLVEAVKQQDERLAEQERRLDALAARLDALEAPLGR